MSEAKADNVLLESSDFVALYQIYATAQSDHIYHGMICYSGEKAFRVGVEKRGQETLDNLNLMANMIEI